MKFSHYSDIGKRELNEDYIAFGSNAFVLCDGVGGETKGEIVSRLVAEKLVDYLEKKSLDCSSQSKIQEILDGIQQEINDRLVLYPEENGMGTTLAAVWYSNQKLFLIHIGDSRIYFIRPAKGLYWKTTDHSVVADLISAGIITEEESRTHPMRNRITRAIQANTTGKLTKADIELLSEIQSGDLVFACSDGVIETLTESQLLDILINQYDSVEGKIIKVRTACQNNSMDNNTAFLIEFEQDEEYCLVLESIQECLIDDLFIPYKVDAGTEFIMTDSNNIEYPEPAKDHKQTKNKFSNFMVFIVATIVTLFIASYTFSFCQRKNKSTENIRSEHAAYNSPMIFISENCIFRC